MIKETAHIQVEPAAGQPGEKQPTLLLLRSGHPTGMPISSVPPQALLAPILQNPTQEGTWSPHPLWTSRGVDLGSMDNTGVKYVLQSTKPCTLSFLMHHTSCLASNTPPRMSAHPSLWSRSHPQGLSSSLPGHRAGQSSNLFAARLTPRLPQTPLAGYKRPLELWAQGTNHSKAP